MFPTRFPFGTGDIGSHKLASLNKKDLAKMLYEHPSGDCDARARPSAII